MKKRFISAIVILMIFVPILLVGKIYYPILGCIMGMIALWEIMRQEKNIPLVVKIISFFLGVYLILFDYSHFDFINLFNTRIIGGLFFIYAFSVIINKDIKKYTYKDGLWLFAMVLIIGLLFNGFIRLRLLGYETVLYCVIISCITDMFAYFGGKSLGKHKLIPTVSPNKTIEGSVIGSLFGTIFGTVYAVLVLKNALSFEIVAVTFLLTIVGQMGDLFFSSIKRHYEVKDFSNIIPGHGGILDRVDSLLFVILAYILYII